MGSRACQVRKAMVAQASGSRRNQVGGSGPRRCSHRLRLVETSEGVVQDQRIPVFHQSGWFDGDGIGSKLNYARMVALGHPNQKLVLGPWATLTWPRARTANDGFL